MNPRRRYLRKYFTRARPLKAQRLCAHLTVEELAVRAGTSTSTVLRAERGEAIHPGNSLALAEALNVPVGWLFPGSPDAASVACATGGYPELEHA